MSARECCGGNGDCPDQGRECPLRDHPDTKRAQLQGLSAVIGVAALIVLLALALSGCERASVKDAEAAETTHSPTVYRDRETGCEYVAGEVNSPLYPRMGRDGKQICRAGNSS